MILNSYNKNNGSATIIMVKGSAVGVTTAATIKINTAAYLLFFLINCGVITPSLERTKITTGSWKIIPVPNVKVSTVERYESIVNVFWILGSTVKLIKKLIDQGAMK